MGDLGFPEAEAALEGVFIPAAPNPFRQRVDPVGVPTPQDDVVRGERPFEDADGLAYRLPGALAAAVEARAPGGPPTSRRGRVAAPVRAGSRLSGDEGRADPCAQAEEEHAAALVAAQRLHGRVVDDLHRLAEGRREVEADPARAEVFRLLRRPVLADQAGVPRANSAS